MPGAGRYHPALAEAVASGSLSEAEAEAWTADNARTDACLNMGVCPDCGRPLSVAVDPRQAGPKPEDTTWVSYRCGHCRYMIDRAEAMPPPDSPS